MRRTCARVWSHLGRCAGSQPRPASTAGRDGNPCSARSSAPRCCVCTRSVRGSGSKTTVRWDTDVPILPRLWVSSTHHAALPGVDPRHRSALGGVSVAEAAPSDHQLVDGVVILLQDVEAPVQQVVSQRVELGEVDAQIGDTQQFCGEGNLLDCSARFWKQSIPAVKLNNSITFAQRFDFFFFLRTFDKSNKKKSQRKNELLWYNRQWGGEKNLSS